MAGRSARRNGGALPELTSAGPHPGTLPILTGWAASWDLAPAGWVLFATLFFRRFPHFLALALPALLVLMVPDKIPG